MPNYPTFAVGQRITADLLAAGQKNTVVKLATTSRASTTTLADDPELTISGVAGTYRVELDIVASGAAIASGGDIQVQWTYTGTNTAGYRVTGGPSDVTQDPIGLAATRWRAFLLSASLSMGYPTSNTANDLTRISEVAPALTFSTAWTITIQWAQQSSLATATNVMSGSSLSAVRLS